MLEKNTYAYVCLNLEITDGVKKLTHMTFFVKTMCCFQPMRVFQKNVYAFITNTSIHRLKNRHMRQTKQRIDVKFDVCVGLKITVA
jgi:hypothetical protein